MKRFATPGRQASPVARRAAGRTYARAWMLGARVLMAALLVCLFAASSARAQTTDDVLYGVDFLAANRVLRIDPATGQAVQAGTLTFGTASAARHPTTGLIYYTEYNINGSNNRVATWNPANGANNTINGTGLPGQPQVVRLGFRANSVLYGMDTANRVYTISAAGAYTSIGIATLVNGTALPTSTGGDISFSPAGTLYLLMNGNLYTMTTANPPRATLVGNTGIASPTGLAFGPDGNLYATDLSGNSTLYLINPNTAATTAIAASGMSITDLAAKPNFANITVAKTATSTFAVGSNNATYRLAVSNAGPAAANGPVIVRDTLPAGISYQGFNGTNWGCIAAAQVITCTHPGPVPINGSLPNLTLTVGVDVPAAPSVTNTATVTSTTFDHVPGNNSGTAVTPVLYVSLQKSHVLNGPNPRPGAEITYTVNFTNAGGVTARNFFLVDVIPFSVDLANSLIVRSTEFKVGSMTFTPGTSTLTLDPTTGRRYFSDPIGWPAPTPPWNPAVAHTPSGAYDPAVTYVGWQFTGNMPAGASGSVTFTVRIR